MKLEGKKMAKIADLQERLGQNDLTSEQYEFRLKGINKIMERNMKIIQFTKNLFETILNSDYNLESFKNS